MSDTQQQQQQVDHLKHQIDTGAQEAKSYLDKLKKNIHEYDEKHPSAHKATDALCSGLDTAESSVNELAHVGAKLKAKSKNASDQSMELARETLLKVKASLCALQDKAHEYDAKFTGSTGTKVAGEVSDSVESIVNSMRQRTTDAIEMATEQITRMSDSAQNAAGTAAHGAQVTVGEVLRVGDKVDEKLGVTEKASSAAGVVAETVKNIDRRMQVTETAAAIDSKVTGGLGARVVNKGVEMVQESIEYVTETLQQAKIAASKSNTAQAADEKATGAIDSASATVGAVQDKVTLAKDQAADAAGTARDKTMEMASSAKETAMGAVDMGGSGSSGSMTGEMKESASSAQEAMSEKAGSVKQGTQEIAGSAKGKAQDVANSAQQKGSEMREGVGEGVSSAKQSAQETAESAKDKAQDTAGAAKQKADEMTGVGTDSGSSGGAGSSGHESSGAGIVDTTKQTAMAAKGKAMDVGTSAKEATMGSGSDESETDVKHKQSARSSEEDAPTTKIAIDVKNASADTMLQPKGMMKDATKA